MSDRVGLFSQPPLQFYDTASATWATTDPLADADEWTGEPGGASESGSEYYDDGYAAAPGVAFAPPSGAASAAPAAPTAAEGGFLSDSEDSELAIREVRARDGQRVRRRLPQCPAHAPRPRP